MTALKPAEIERTLAKPSKDVRIYLVYGPDSGLVQERVNALVKTLLGEAASDPLALSDLKGEEIASEPAKIADEAFAVSFFVTQKVLRIALNGRNIAASLKTLLENNIAPHPVVIDGGDLKKGEAVRALCEGHKLALAIPCYADTAQDLRRLIETELRNANLRIAPPVMQILISHLGADRALSRRELEKLILYVQGQTEISIADIEAILVDSAAQSVDQVIDALFLGPPERLVDALSRAEQSADLPPQALANVALRHAMQMDKYLTEIARGKRRLAEDAFPEVFWSRRASVLAQLKRWQSRGMADAVQQLERAVAQTRQQAPLAEAILGQTFLNIERMRA